jgi:hypothetical protein
MVEFKKKLVFSKSYTTTANIAAGAKSAERFISQEDIDQYAPFDTIVVSNADPIEMSLLFDHNPDNAVPISASGAIGSSDQQFADFSLKNEDGATAHTAGKIRILVQKFKYERIV